MKNVLFWIVGLAFLALLGWWGSFGTKMPCEVLREQVIERTAKHSPDVQERALYATRNYSMLVCAVTAVRLKAGDESALKIVVVGGN